MDACCAEGDTWWVGFWVNCPGQLSPYFVGADLNGPGGCPKNNIAPGIGYPSGWQDVAVAWGPTAAMGIGAEVLPCGPVAIERATWGSVKALYQ